VRHAGRASWEMRIDQPQHLAIGLFIRDIAMLPSHRDWLPPASPVVSGADDRSSQAAAPQWDAWWDQSMRKERQTDTADGRLSASWWDPPAFESLRQAPALQAIVTAHFSDAVRWSEDRKHEHVTTMMSCERGLVETTLVSDMERAMKRTAQPFRLQITEIPVAGQELWQLRPDHVLVSTGLLRDTAHYRRRLTPVVHALW